MHDHTPRSNILNTFTVDLEEWFCFRERGIPNYEEWERLEPRVTIGTEIILRILAEHRIEATFFVLGWVAERRPDLIRKIADAGHEIATHGYSHAMLTMLTPDQFRHDLERALKATERATGTTIKGFRAPRFSVTRDTRWSIDILREMGLCYDSSVFPYAGHPDYGIADAPLDIYSHDNGIIEIPMSCAVVAGRRIPCGGGGYFRLMPYFMTRQLIDSCHRNGRGVIFYIHPWELDPGQPRLPPVALIVSVTARIWRAWRGNCMRCCAIFDSLRFEQRCNGELNYNRMFLRRLLVKKDIGTHEIFPRLSPATFVDCS